MFELSGNTQFLYCIECGRSDFIHEAVGGKQFHIEYQITSNDSGFYAEPVECFGPFVQSEPPSSAELWYAIEQHPTMEEIISGDTLQ